ncbi:MAG TPA: hypothetical protein PL018_12335 [Ignavibacteriaceae bacterium]|nr:hypothetical protein [Ignavibacteriaceae bacterium]
MTPLKAIRKNCLECSSGSASEVNNCIITDCPLYQFRLGKNPNRAGIGRKYGNPHLNEKTLTQLSRFEQRRATI